MDKLKHSKNIRIIQIDSKRDFKQILRETQADIDFRVMILSFADEHSFKAKNASDERLVKQIKNFPIPVIAIIKDLAKDFVFEIVVASHLCIASESAEFKIENVEDLKTQIGKKNAGKLTSTENEISAEKALDLGFINKAVPQKDLEKEAFEMAETIASLAPLAIRSCLKAVNEGLKMNLENGLKLETELFAQIFATEDMKEGTRAFLEKRKPNFQGK